MTRLHRSGHFKGFYWQPRETTQHQLGPIWATFGLLNSKTLCCSFFTHLVDCPNCTQFSSLKCTRIIFGLNCVGHSKFHITLLYPPMQVVPPLIPSSLFSCPAQRKRGRPELVPMTGVRYNSLLWTCTLNTLTMNKLIIKAKLIDSFLLNTWFSTFFISIITQNHIYVSPPINLTVEPCCRWQHFQVQSNLCNML